MWRRIPLRHSYMKLQKVVKNGDSLRAVISSVCKADKLPASANWCSMATYATQPGTKVMVKPASCLQDESVSLSVDGLQPGQEVTLQASMVDTRGVQFISFAHYKADNGGQVDVNTMTSLGGSYKGVFPMGLLSGLSPALKKHTYTRFSKRDVEHPNIVTLSVFEGHLSKEELTAEDTKQPLSTAVHQRHYMAPGVQRISVRYGRVRACLFLPPGDGPFPGVVDIFGIAGGLPEYRSAQLASRGIASLALAIFGYDDLPKQMEEFEMSYFEEAVEFLLKHDKIQKPNVGAIGLSKGGDLSLAMSTFIPEVTAGVSINGCICSTQSSLILHDGTIPGLQFNLSRIQILDDVVGYYEAIENPLEYPETIIPIERADANFLFLVSGDDRNWKSEMYADMAVERLKQAGKRNITVHKYPEAGHLFEPPFTPFCHATYHKLVKRNMLYGGSLFPHSEAEVHAWEAMLAFLWQHLHNDTRSKGKL